MRRDRGWDRDRPRDWDRDRDRDRDRNRSRERDRDRGRVSRVRPEPSPLRKHAAEPGLRHPSGGGSAPPPSRHLWVGNLASTVSEKMLYEEFQRFGNVESLNHLPGRSYAFVNYSREQDAVRALRALQGIRFDGSPIKIEFSKGDMEPSDILWIGFPANLNVDETALRTVFSPFGEIIRIATFPGRSYAFVHYRDVASASRARETLNGKLFNNPRVHISFARSDAFNDAAGSGGARRSPPRRLDREVRDPDFEGYRRDFHSRSMSPRDKTTFDWSHNEPIRRSRGNIHYNEDRGPSFQRRQRLDYDEPHPLPVPFERRQVSYSDDPYPLHLPPHERRRGPYPDDSRILPPPVDHRRGPEFDDYYPVQKRMRVSPDTFGGPESELPEYPFDELSRGRPTRVSQVNEGFAGARAGPGGGVLDVSMAKFSSSNTKIVKEVWKWEGVIAKGGATVCQARCFPVGKTLDFMLPEILNCSARTNLEMLSRHYYQAAASWVVFFAPGSDADIASYNDFMHYLSEKQRVAVAKLEEKVSLFLVPPSEFTEKVLKVPGKLSISGLVLRFNQQMDTDQDPGPTFNQLASKPGRVIENSLVSKTHNSPDFRSHVGPSSGNFTSGNFSSFTPPHMPPNSIQQQNHGSSALGFAPQPPFNPIQGPGISGFVPPQPNPIQQQVHEAGTSGFAPQPPTNPHQQQNLEQGYASSQRTPPTNPFQQQNLELGPASFERPPPHNTLKQQNLERSPIGFPHPLPPNSTQQRNLEPYNSGFPQQPPSNPTWQQTQQPPSAGGYNPVQNNSFSGNFQLRPEFTSNYMAAPPPLPPGPPPPRAVVPPSIPQPVSMPFQFGTNYPNYEQGVQEQIHNQNPNPNVSSVMNSMPQPSYTSQAHLQGQIQNQNPNSYLNLNPNPNSNVNSMNNVPQPSYTILAPMQEQIQNQNQNPNPNPNSNMNPMTNSTPPPSYSSQAPVPPGFWGLSVGQGVASGPPAVQQQQQQQQQQQGGGGSGGAGSNNALDPDRQKRLEATMQLAAVLLQQMQQQSSSGTDKQ